MLRILVADDDAVSRRLTQHTLALAGYEVICVDNGFSALEHLSQPGGARLALLDWLMPGLDGPTVCRLLRQRTSEPYTYLILLTAKTDKADLVAGLGAGADDYLTKPCHADELAARFRTGTRILELQDKLFHDARYDSLTHLPNRAYFLDRLKQSIARSTEEPDYRFAVLFVDLDRFKRVNDSFGHSAGDELLVQVGARLLGSIRRERPNLRISSAKRFGLRTNEDVLARLSGDEFTVLLEGVRGEAEAVEVAKRIQNDLILSFPVAGQHVQITASIGISVGASHHDAETIMHAADVAMYGSKATGTVTVSTSISITQRRKFA